MSVCAYDDSCGEDEQESRRKGTVAALAFLVLMAFWGGIAGGVTYMLLGAGG